MSEELVKRLRATYRKEHVPTGSTVGNLPLVRNVILTTNVLYNPDGPKAADTIEAQAAEIERLREAGTKLAGFAEHDFGCLHYERNDSCDCGYTQAWKAWNAGLGETK